MVYRRWNIPQIDDKKLNNLKNQLGAPNLLCKVLLSRGIDNATDANNFISATAELPNPMDFKDMDKLVARILAAIENHEKIVVFGDYDVDGVTATALMVTYLESIGAQVFYKLPTRTEDGYGLTKSVIKAIAEKEVGLIITVDNGVNACAEVEYATELGVDIVVTDHHLPSATLPKAVAVVNPLRVDDTTAAKNLSGVGVAYMAICAIEGCDAEEMLGFYSDLVAIGTIADIMVLKGANRTIVKAGIENLQNTERVGLLALLEKCSLSGKPITSENISFGLSPRLNAAGRMDNAVLSLELLLEEDFETAQQMASEIEKYNTDRQQIEQKITAELMQKIETENDYTNSPVLVVWGERYHQGVIGIVASRILERFNKPTIVLTIDENGEAKGSGRSFAGFSLHNAIASCEDLLIRFGGHDLAAGLSIEVGKLDEFAKRINDWARQNSPVVERSGYNVDASIKISEISIEEIEAIDYLAPFGQGNVAPSFAVQNSVIEAVFPLSDGKHTRIKLVQNQNTLFAAIFGTTVAEFPYKVGDTVDIIVSLSVFQGQSKMISGRIKAIRPANIGNDYIDLAQLYHSYRNGAKLTEKQIDKICPVRQDVVDIYRYISQTPIHKNDLCPIFSMLGADKTGKILAAVDILKELGHICEKNIDGSKIYVKSDTVQKKPLAESCILAQLEGKKG